LLNVKLVVYIVTLGCKGINLSYENQSVYAERGTSPCLFPGKYKTHKYGVDRAYSC